MTIMLILLKLRSWKTKPAIIGEVYPNPTNLCLNEFSSVYVFIEVTEKLVEELEDNVPYNPLLRVFENVW